jgi:hypothetical protein
MLKPQAGMKPTSVPLNCWKPQDDDIHFDICESHLEEEKAKGEEV